MIKYPKKIVLGDTIGITATSSGVSEDFDKERLNYAINNLNKLGFQVLKTNNLSKNSKFASSSGKVRAKEFMDLWQDSNVSVIAQARGGELLMEMLPYIDSNIITSNQPKWVTGYSDCSLLNFYLTTNFNIATLTCDNILNFSEEKLDKSLKDQLSLLQTTKDFTFKNYDLCEGSEYKSKKLPTDSYNLIQIVKYKHLYNKKEDYLSGILIGGCLETLVTIVGTKYDKTVDFCKQFKNGMLWYLDIFDSNPLALERILFQMKEAGWFFNANGFLIGRTRAIANVLDLTRIDVLHKIFDDMNVPVILDVDIGHVKPMFSIINGSLGEFKYKNNKGELKLIRK